MYANRHARCSEAEAPSILLGLFLFKLNTFKHSCKFYIQNMNKITEVLVCKNHFVKLSAKKCFNC